MKPCIPDKLPITAINIATHKLPPTIYLTRYTERLGKPPMLVVLAVASFVSQYLLSLNSYLGTACNSCKIVIPNLLCLVRHEF